MVKPFYSKRNWIKPQEKVEIGQAQCHYKGYPHKKHLSVMMVDALIGSKSTPRWVKTPLLITGNHGPCSQCIKVWIITLIRGMEFICRWCKGTKNQVSWLLIYRQRYRWLQHVTCLSPASQLPPTHSPLSRDQPST